MAFERLYERYAARLLGFVVALGVPVDAAEDVCQKVWLRVIHNLVAYRGFGRFRPWLFRIAHRQWLDEARSAWQRHRMPLDRPGTEAEWADPGAGPIDIVLARERHQLLLDALAELPPAMRQTVLLRIDGELTFREIADAMACPLGTALWRMKEAERRLARRLGALEPEFQT